MRQEFHFSAILAELSSTVKVLANQHVPSIPFEQELAMGDRALQTAIESQIFRVIEILVLITYTSFFVKNFVLPQEPAYIDSGNSPPE